MNFDGVFLGVSVPVSLIRYPQFDVSDVFLKDGSNTTEAPTISPISELNGMASKLAVYAPQCRLPGPTQDSLLSVGQLSQAGLEPARIPTKGFSYSVSS